MRRTIRIGARVALVATVVFAAPPLRAQTVFELAPFGGYYRPTEGFTNVQETATWLPRTPEDLSGFMAGLDARWWFHNQVGLQAEAGVAYSTMHSYEISFAPGGAQENIPESLGAQVQIASVQVMGNMAPANANYRVWASAGPAVIHRGGDAYNLDPTFTKSYDVGAAFGLGGDIPLGHRLHVTVGVQSLLYWDHVDNPEDHHSIERGFQDDLTLHTGLAWRVR